MLDGTGGDGTSESISVHTAVVDGDIVNSLYFISCNMYLPDLVSLILYGASAYRLNIDILNVILSFVNLIIYHFYFC